MEENEKSLADSSGSDGSLSKDLSKRAEMNFSAHSVQLQIDGDESVGHVGGNDLVPATPGQSKGEIVPMEEEVLTTKKSTT